MLKLKLKFVLNKVEYINQKQVTAKYKISLRHANKLESKEEKT